MRAAAKHFHAPMLKSRQAAVFKPAQQWEPGSRIPLGVRPSATYGAMMCSQVRPSATWLLPTSQPSQPSQPLQLSAVVLSLPFEKAFSASNQLNIEQTCNGITEPF
eukprot:s193_g26.t1